MFITRRTTPYLYEAPEDGAQAPNAETPDTTPAANEAAPTQQEIDWAKRYSDLQPEYTRVTQELSQFRTREQAYQALLFNEDPDTRRQAAEALGVELADDENPNDTQHDPLEELRAELNSLKQGFTQQQTQAQEAQMVAQMEQHSEQQMDALGLPKGDEGSPEESVRDWIVSRACALPPTDEGQLDIRAAHQQFTALIDAEKRTWAKTKRTHHISPAGQTGTQTPDWDSMSRGERDELMAEMVRARNEM